MSSMDSQLEAIMKKRRDHGDPRSRSRRGADGDNHTVQSGSSGGDGDTKSHGSGSRSSRRRTATTGDSATVSSRESKSSRKKPSQSRRQKSSSSISQTEEGDAPKSDGFGGDNWGAFGSNTTDVAAAPADFGGGGGGFGSFPMDFAPTDNSASFFEGESAFAGGNPFESKNASDGHAAPSFALTPPPKPKKVYDKTPIENPPQHHVSAGASFLHEPKKILSQPCVPGPCTNPLNGNIVCCKKRADGEFIIAEIDSRRGTQVLSTPVLSVELQRRVSAKYNLSACAVDSVLKCTVGVHKAHGHTRPRMSALIDLLVLENVEVLRVIAIWQWGYGTSHPVVLQSMLSPPSGSDFIYNTESLLVSDSCVFVSGASAKGPCVFLCKPTVKETWSANFVGKDSVRISDMAVLSSANIVHPYLAVALTDGSLSVWTYEPATQVTAKSKEAPRRLLYPLCRLEGSKALARCKITQLLTNESQHEPDQSKEIGYCTSIEWVPSKISCSSMLLLAASYQSGLVFYHLALPVSLDSNGNPEPLKAPTSSTQISSTVSIKPFGVARWPKVYHRSTLAWLDLGPHESLCVSVLLKGSNANMDYAKIVVAKCEVPMYTASKDRKSSQDEKSSIRILSSNFEWSSLTHTTPQGILTSHNQSGVVYYSPKAIYILRANDKVLGRYGHLVCSQPAGLSSSGVVWLRDPNDGKQGVLHVHSVLQCDQRKISDSSSLGWSPPTRRHWLVRTLAGDCKDSSKPEQAESKQGDQDGHDEGIVYGGASTDTVCEIGGVSGLDGMMPCRINRSVDGAITAILLREIDGIQADCTKIAFVERDDAANFKITQVLEGRDICFPPSTSNDDPGCLVLSCDGGCLSEYKKTPSDHSGTWEQKTSFRSILGDFNDDAIDCRRVITREHDGKYSLVVFGTRISDDRGCIILGELQAILDPEDDVWPNSLPNIEEDVVFWLKEDEEIYQMISLPSEDHICGGIGVATNQRVLILNSKMKLAGASSFGSPARSLVPMGSSAVAFCGSDYKIRYVAGLDQRYSNGLIATLPGPVIGYCPYLLLAIRPDRLLYTQLHTSASMIGKEMKPRTIQVPTAITRPALLLEPLVANAISTGGKDIGSMPLLRTVIERFGRKVASLAHGEGEGIGDLGSGISPRVFELLSRYSLNEASSWLMTGTVSFDRAANSRLLPHWMPLSSKANAAKSADTNLHLIAHGDQYFSEYVKSPDTNMTSTLPRPSDPSAFMCNGFASTYLGKGDITDSLKMLDLVGTESADAVLLQLSLAMQLDRRADSSNILQALCQSDGQNGNSLAPSTSASLAALALQLKSKKIKAQQPGSNDFTNRWMKQMAPSLQRGRRLGRARPKIIGELAFAKIRKSNGNKSAGSLFASETNESKHVWNEGPKKKKENLLMLDNIQEWFGRRRPIILGKEGAENAEGKGAKTLADILNKSDDDSFGGENDDDFKDGWVEGVGEGLDDKDKLCAYYRMSEGDDDETSWKEEGFTDLTRFENRAILVGVSDPVTLEPSTSSVDEGESGKVRALFDLVFEESGAGRATGFALPANRGGSLDIGIMHGPDHDSRQKCTMEFWFWVPEEIKKDVILARRTIGSSADDMEKVCLSSEKSSSLWDFVLDKKGELTLRTAAGSKAKTEPTTSKGDDDEDVLKSTVTFGRWNHVCITMKQTATTSATIGLFVKGENAFSKELSFSPPEIEADEFAGASIFDGPLAKSHVIFGIDHPAGFRMTELRVWAMERMQDDIRSFMTEYLECAEIKRKFRVKIKKKGGGGKLAMPSSGLAPPGEPRGALAPPGGLKPPGDASVKSSRKTLLARPKGSRDEGSKSKLAPPKEDRFDLPAISGSDEQSDLQAVGSGFSNDAFDNFATPKAETPKELVSFGSEFATGPDGFTTNAPTPVKDSGGFGELGPTIQTDAAAKTDSAVDVYAASDDDDEDMGVEISPLWDSAIPLSEQVRSSAAAALIRGPPATRHFGGNRGGLPDYRELERFGVGAISICGSEKTIVWRDDQVPPGLTYPIGASGAVVSDQMDEDGSEFLCCFQAKEKRMVVFELSTRTVVVELQMTTKLNYWRFLPPEAGEDTLCFMLITPVGGFHWMPLDESPRPRQVWKRGSELQGKKIVCYEEGGTNGLDGPEMLSKVGMLLVTNASNGGRLETWLVPICGDSQAICASDDVLGSCLCCPPGVGYEAWMPLLLFVVQSDKDLVVCVSAVTEGADISIALTEVMTDALIELGPYKDFDFTPPTLSMGTWPEVLCCSLGSTIVIIVRRKGLVVAYELADTGLELIAEENVGHYVVDAVMRYSAVEGGAEIVLLMSDSDNPRDGRVGTFCFRSAM